MPNTPYDGNRKRKQLNHCEQFKSTILDSCLYLEIIKVKMLLLTIRYIPLWFIISFVGLIVLFIIAGIVVKRYMKKDEREYQHNWKQIYNRK